MIPEVKNVWNEFYQAFGTPTGETKEVQGETLYRIYFDSTDGSFSYCWVHECGAVAHWE